MFDSYLIEIDEIEAGLLIRDGDGYAFHAVAPRFRAFEGARFPDPWSAERALRRQAARPARPGARTRPSTGSIGPDRPHDRKVG